MQQEKSESKTSTDRFMFNVPKDINREEMQRLIRHQLNDDSFVLSEELFNDLKRADEEKEWVRNFIGPFYTELEKDDSQSSKAKRDELIDIGRFAYHLSNSHQIEIVELKEAPDFIIKFDDEIIGVEHTRLIDSEIIAEYKNIRRVLSEAEETLAKKKPGLKGLFNFLILPGSITLDNKSLIQLLRTERSKVPQIIAEFVEAFLEDKNPEPPEFISKFSYTNHSVLELSLSEEYTYQELTADRINDLIQSKEKKVAAYKNSCDKIWLLVIIGGATAPTSFKVDIEKLPVDGTAFDTVFIFDTFKGVMIGGKNKQAD